MDILKRVKRGLKAKDGGRRSNGGSNASSSNDLRVTEETTKKRMQCSPPLSPSNVIHLSRPSIIQMQPQQHDNHQHNRSASTDREVIYGKKRRKEGRYDHGNFSLGVIWVEKCAGRKSWQSNIIMQYWI